MDDRKQLLQRRNSAEKAALGKGSLNATIIFEICRKGDFNSLKAILNQRKDITKLRDQNNRSLLHYCSEAKDIQCAQLLIEASPELLTQQDNDGYSVLHLSVINSNKLLTRYLCQQYLDASKKAQFINCSDSEGHTPFHWATVCSEIECLETLYNEGASAALADNHGAFPLHYASQMCGVNNVASKSSKIRIELLKKLLSFSNVDVNCKDNDGRTPLLWASSAG
ncbi:ankycorbin-like protein [Leptotrombidium deliense]|uniref:Alpha-latrotoxin n=1 Tax=Leptotrombidium deliense TaxID=299467 RepID=A0A443SB13_9ACAR|nr:ankycorbin-like protein [Leptotrombidium deliense]